MFRKQRAQLESQDVGIQVAVIFYYAFVHMKLKQRLKPPIFQSVSMFPVVKRKDRPRYGPVFNGSMLPASLKLKSF
jgi:hypothetical protein